MDLESLQSALLVAARERSMCEVLGALVQGLADQPETALARIWLIAPGDICDTCFVRSECPDQTRCMHLVASAGSPREGPRDWSSTDGRFRRFPLGIRKIGVIGASGEPHLVGSIDPTSPWLADRDWLEREQIRAFAGQPLVFRDEILGVLGLFARCELVERDFAWLRMFADHAATAIANARANEEIERLKTRLQDENVYLRQQVNEALTGAMIGHSPALKKTLQQVELVAPTDTSVLIEGESGTGKELIAHSIHAQSRRRERALITVNCASIPKDLFESEFFGHVRGSFTGAIGNRVGRFQLADGGTLFLDEVGEIPLELQGKLLRVLQEGEFERVGDAKTTKADVRLLSATNRNLYDEVEAGRFRQDLYYRLSAFPITVPPLRHRPEDIEDLATHFIQIASRKLGVPPAKLTRAQLGELSRYTWPGNVRELQHVVERAVILSLGESATPGQLAIIPLSTRRPARVRTSSEDPRAAPESSATTEAGASRATGSASVAGTAPVQTPPPAVVPLSEMKRRERDSIVAALEQAAGKVYGPGGAAELLRVKPTTLASRLKSLGIDKKDFTAS